MESRRTSVQKSLRRVHVLSQLVPFYIVARRASQARGPWIPPALLDAEVAQTQNLTPGRMATARARNSVRSSASPSQLEQARLTVISVQAHMTLFEPHLGQQDLSRLRRDDLEPPALPVPTAIPDACAIQRPPKPAQEWRMCLAPWLGEGSRGGEAGYRAANGTSVALHLPRSSIQISTRCERSFSCGTRASTVSRTWSKSCIC